MGASGMWVAFIDNEPFIDWGGLMDWLKPQLTIAPPFPKEGDEETVVIGVQFRELLSTVEYTTAEFSWFIMFGEMGKLAECGFDRAVVGLLLEHPEVVIEYVRSKVPGAPADDQGTPKTQFDAGWMEQVGAAVRSALGNMG